MASSERVRAYLAYWFQLGKPIVFDHSQTTCLPYPIFSSGRYSDAFETCWQQIQSKDGQDCHLRGTDQSVAELMSAAWDIHGCARCTMPVPVPVAGVSESPCPCYDLAIWPNEEIPAPRLMLGQQDSSLGTIRDRLQARAQLQSIYQRSPQLPQPERDRATSQEASKDAGS